MSPAGLSPGRLRHLHDVMGGYVDRGEVPGIVTLVSRRGEVLADCDIDTARVPALAGLSPGNYPHLPALAGGSHLYDPSAQHN